MKRWGWNLTLGLLAGLVSRQVSAAPVFISEYVEPSSGNTKVLEIYNGSGAAIDMADYRIGKASNGAPTPTFFTLNGSVAAGDVFVACHSSSVAEVLALADFTNGSLDWNGDDFVGLYQMISGSPVLIDAIGILDEDPGTAWAVAGDASGTANHTLARKPSILQGNTNWTVSAGTNVSDSEWVVLPAQTFSGIGSHSVDGGDTPPSISGLAHLPLLPTPMDAVTVTADVSDDSGLTAVNLVYSVDGSAAQTVAMSLGVAPQYSGAIPAQILGAEIAYHVEATDDASQTSNSGNGSYTVSETSTMEPGDLLITEIMNNPAAVFDNLGEWFEIHNPTTEAVALSGLIVRDGGGNQFTVDSTLTLQPGEYLVLGNNADSGTNGGLVVNFEYAASFALNNSGSESLILLAGATEIDRVDYAYGATPAWPLTGGASFYLLDAETDNNVATNWTLSSIPYGDGDFGTPGGVTPSDVPPTVANLAFSPLQPTSVDAVTVTADVSDDLGLTAVNLVYTVDGGAAQTVAMTLGVAPQYSGTIPAQADLASVSFHVEATDTGSNTTSSANGGYLVSDSFPCADIATIRANDAGGEPILMGQVRSVCGVVTMSNQLGTAGPVYITGTTGSVALYGTGFLTGVTIGDEIQATGTVGFFNGLTELITPTFLNIVGHPGEPTPVAATLAGLIADGESFEAQLVQVENLELQTGAVWPATGSNGTVTVTNGVDEFTLFIDRDTDIDGSAVPAGTFDLSAVIGQYDSSSPYTSGYQLIPRSLADFTFSGNQPASISGISHAPYVPTSAEAVTVSATISDDVAVTGATLYYRANGGAYSGVSMSNVGDVYSGTIPTQADLAVVDYYLTAMDAEATTTSADFSYTVYDVFPCGDISAMRVLDANGVPVMVDQHVFVCGTVTATNQFDATRGPVYITGPTGSMAVYGTAALPAGLQLGDDYQAIGIVKNYMGLIELDPTEFSEITGHSGPVAPLAVTLAQLIAAPETYEARLVEVTGLTLDPGAVWPAPGSNATLTVWQGTDSFALQIDKDTDLDEGMAPAGVFSLRALLGQYDTSSPYSAGYQLLPRFQADILTAPDALDAPVVSIAISGGTATLSWASVAGATDYVVYTAMDGYSGWDAGVSTMGAISHTAAVSGRAFFQVVAVN